MRKYLLEQRLSTFSDIRRRGQRRGYLGISVKKVKKETYSKEEGKEKKETLLSAE